MLLDYWPLQLVKTLENPGYHAVKFHWSARKRNGRGAGALPLKGVRKISHSLPILNCCTNWQASLEILQSSNDHSCILQTISSVSRGTHCWFQESHGKNELQTDSANWELSNYGGIQIYGRRCLYVALYDMPGWIGWQAVVLYWAACFSAWACCRVLRVCFAPSFVHLHTAASATISLSVLCVETHTKLH